MLSIFLGLYFVILKECADAFVLFGFQIIADLNKLLRPYGPLCLPFFKLDHVLFDRRALYSGFAGFEVNDDLIRVGQGGLVNL